MHPASMTCLNLNRLQKVWWSDVKQAFKQNQKVKDPIFALLLHLFVHLWRLEIRTRKIGRISPFHQHISAPKWPKMSSHWWILRLETFRQMQLAMKYSKVFVSRVSEWNFIWILSNTTQYYNQNVVCFE